MDDELVEPTPLLSLAGAGVGCLSLLVLLLAPPLLVSLHLLFVEPVPPFSYASIAVAPVVAAALGASVGKPRRRLVRFGGILMLLLVISVIPVTTCFALDRLTAGAFGVETTPYRVPSPDGRLYLIESDIDDGALGGGSKVYVEGSLVPGLLGWHYRIGGEEVLPPQGWDDGRHVVAGGRRYAIPWVMTWLRW